MSTLNTIFQFRRDTQSNWEAVAETFIPKAGEPCVTMDGDNKGQLKIGDGVTSWGTLKYVGAISVDDESISFDNGVLTIFGFDTATTNQQLRKTADGKIEWFTPDASTVEGLTQDVNQLKTDVSDLQTEVAKKANSEDVYTKIETDEQINAKIASAYKPAGSVAFADLPEPTSALLGNVYNVTDAFTAGDKFIASEVGKEYSAGTNVAVVEQIVNDTTVYLFDALSGFVDLSGYVTLTDFTPVKNTVDSLPTPIVTGIHETPVYSPTDVTLDYTAYVKGESGTYSESETDGVVTIGAATDTQAGVLSAADKAKLDGISEGAEVNVIEKVLVGTVELPITNKSVTIPIATDEALGAVKSSVDVVNMVEVLADGTMELNSFNTSRLTQDEEIILNGGIGAGSFTPQV